MSLLGLEISPRIRGFSGNPLEYAVVRELTLEDIPLLDQIKRTPQKSLKRLSNRHHAAARNIALGMKHVEVAAITGYHPNTINYLLDDPAFKELVEFYRTSIDKENRTNFERLSGIAADAADEIQERLENSPEEIPMSQLIEIVKVGADRSGNGPTSSNVQVNINVGIAERLKRAREIAQTASKALPGPDEQIIDLEVNK